FTRVHGGWRCRECLLEHIFAKHVHGRPDFDASGWLAAAQQYPAVFSDKLLHRSAGNIPVAELTWAGPVVRRPGHPTQMNKPFVFVACLVAAASTLQLQATTFTGPGAAFPDTSAARTGTPYPSTNNVTGLAAGPISSVKVSLNNLTHP